MELILICPTAKLERFQKNANRMTEVLENMTPNWQTPSQVSSAPTLKYFPCPRSRASQLQLKICK